jgi:AraC-like DNA-binding protein
MAPGPVAPLFGPALFPCMHLIRMPSGPLSPFVDSLWHSQPSAPRAARERILPTGRMQIVISLGSNAVRLYAGPASGTHVSLRDPTILCGAASNHRMVGLPRNDTLIGVVFRAGGLHPFIRSSLRHAGNCVIPLSDSWTDMSSLRCRLISLDDPDRRLEILEQYLLERLPPSARLHPAVDHAISTFGRSLPPVSIADVTRDVGLSARRFITVFTDQVGLTPKVFSRVNTFQRVLHAAHTLDRVDWAKLALEHGYFDQAHMVHDFTAFAGLSPSAYRRSRTPFANHVDAPDPPSRC